MFVKGVGSRNYVMRTKLMSDRLLKEGHEVRRLQNSSSYAKLRHSLNNFRNHNLINSLNSGNCCSIFIYRCCESHLLKFKIYLHINIVVILEKMLFSFIGC